MTRTRSEYRRSLGSSVVIDAAAPVVGRVSAAQRDELAPLLLAAYRGTVDDEGETEADAMQAIDYYLTTIDRDASVTLAIDGGLVAFAFVVTVNDVKYIDPVVTRPDLKRTGLGRTVVAAALSRLAAAGVPVVGAAITDGNTASERLFTSLEFTRVGTWPPRSLSA